MADPSCWNLDRGSAGDFVRDLCRHDSFHDLDRDRVRRSASTSTKKSCGRECFLYGCMALLNCRLMSKGVPRTMLRH